MVAQIIGLGLLSSHKEVSLFARGALARSLVEQVRAVPEIFGSPTSTRAEPRA